MIGVAEFIGCWFIAVFIILWFFHNAIGDEPDEDIMP